MMDTLMVWAGTPWGIAGLIGIAWIAVSCVFSVVLGRIMAEFGGDGRHDVPKLDQPERRDPRRAGDASGTRKQRRMQKTSTG